jgi:putative MATE family efflux protein
MKDMTKGPVAGHVLQLAGFIALTMLFQTLYFLADLYFVGTLGKEAVAGVSLSGNLSFAVLALTQALGVGATSLVAQALGRKEPAQAELVFNQALVLATFTGLGFGVLAFLGRGAYCGRLAADAATAGLGVQYLTWFIPALVMQFPLVALGAALRGMGDVKVPTLIQVATVLLNIVLAPTLIFGWLSGRPLGVQGAALASLIAIVVGCIAFVAYFRRALSPFRFRPADWSPRPRLWGAILKIGLPAGGEFALLSFYMVLVYVITRRFGASAQAGFGIGVRVMQALFLPAVAIAFATAPVVGQNFGARLGARVREAARTAALMAASVMMVFTVLCHIAPDALVRVFSKDATVVAFGSEYLRIVSWNFVASGLVFVLSSVFQGLGNTLPALGSSALRLLLFALPAYLVSQRPGFEMRHVWYLSVASVTLQVLINLWLLARELRVKLPSVALPETQPLPSPS